MARVPKNLVGALTAPAFRFRRETTGSAVVEFALLAPVLFMLLIGMFQFGILINNYIQVTEATRVGGRTLAISRGSNSPIATTRAAIFASAPGLTQSNFTITLTPAVGSCPSTVSTANETSCKDALTSSQGLQASVTVVYGGCTNLMVYGANYMPNCNLSSTTSMRVE